MLPSSHHLHPPPHPSPPAAMPSPPPKPAPLLPPHQELQSHKKCASLHVTCFSLLCALTCRSLCLQALSSSLYWFGLPLCFKAQFKCFSVLCNFPRSPLQFGSTVCKSTIGKVLIILCHLFCVLCSLISSRFGLPEGRGSPLFKNETT